MNSTTPTTDDDSILIVIVNYRTAPLVVDCLRSLQPEVQAHPATRVRVVDNCSDDGSVNVIAKAIEANAWESWVELLPSTRNGGFSYGNNLAIRPTLQQANAPAHYWLLNPDTLVRAGALRAILDFMKLNPRVGIAGSSLENEDGTPWPYAFRFPSLLSELERGFRLGFISKLLSSRSVLRRMGTVAEQVDWLPGASMFVRKEVFDTIGLMDEKYFLYFEETDFCLQANRHGWECWYVPQSRIMHISGQSTGVTAKTDTPKRLPDYWFDSRRRYFVKNHGRLYSACTDLVWLLSFMTWRLRRLIQRHPDTDPPKLLSDFIRCSALFRG